VLGLGLDRSNPLDHPDVTGAEGDEGRGVLAVLFLEGELDCALLLDLCIGSGGTGTGA
jgi:hypothetical protein